MNNQITRDPFSGNVSQMINPWTLWLKSLNQQMGFININNLSSKDPDIEKKIVEDVASYGRQLGWIIEVLDLIVPRLDYKDLTEDELCTLHKFSDLIKDIEDVKGYNKPQRLTLGNIDRMINDIQSLKKKDAATYTKMVSHIKEAFPNEDI